MILKCKMCGGELQVEKGQTICECEYCGTKQTLPKLSNKKRVNLFDRANHYRRNNEFDKASDLYERILSEDSSDAEAYWSLVLCEYGVEYVEDPASHKRVPTVNRTQFKSIFTDDNYKSALENASIEQKIIYEEEAKAIDDIQKGILDISRKEEPFDIFICYKETDAKGRRTIDSVLANDIYHELTKEGYKVFFSRITLEDKLGVAYEPYIFAALNSSKVMVALGTKAEYFNAVWVKNEWNRYLKLIAADEKKTLIPAYRDMDPYDLPEEFSHLQALDMSKLGFMQDLVRGIRKIIQGDQKETEKVTVISSAADSKIEPLLKRAFIFLEDNDFESADKYFDRVLDQDPENGNAYLGKAMVELNLNTIDDFVEHYRKRYDDNASENAEACQEETEHISEMVDRYKIPGYLDEETIRKKYEFDRSADLLSASRKRQKEQIVSEFRNNRLLNRIQQFADKNLHSRVEEIFDAYDERISAAAVEDEQKIIDISRKYKEFLDETDQSVAKMYEEALNNRDSDYDSLTQNLSITTDLKVLNESLNKFKELGDFKDSSDYVSKAEERIRQQKEINNEIQNKKFKKRILIGCAVVAAAIGLLVYHLNVVVPRNSYANAVSLAEKGNYDEAIAEFEKLGDYLDSKDQITEAKYQKAQSLYKKKDYAEAIGLFDELGDYKESKEILKDVRYDYASYLYTEENIDDAVKVLKDLGDYKDSLEIMDKINEEYVYLEDFTEESLTDAQNAMKEAGINNYVIRKVGGTAGKIISTDPVSGYISKATTVVINTYLGTSDLKTYYGDGNGSVLFQIKINPAGNSVRVRTYPVALSDLSNKVANLSSGTTHKVYEVLLDSDYTWYRIGNKRWIATESGWVSIVDSATK